MTFTFRPIRLPDDEEKLLDLLLLGFPELAGTVSGTVEHLRWKFSLSAAQGLSLIGFEGDRAVAFYGVIPLQYSIEGQVRQIGLVVDVMSHPEVRRRGLFESTGRAAMNNLAGGAIEAVLGYPIRDDVMPGHLKIGWKAGFKLPVYLLPTGWRDAGQADPSRWLSMFAFAAHCYRVGTAPLRLGRRGSITHLAPTEFVNHAVVRSLREARASAHHLVLSEEFLTWRLARPGADYTCAVIQSATSTGYAVVRKLELRGVPSLTVLAMDSSDRRGSRLVVDALISLARRERVTAIAFCANREHARELHLTWLGFIRSPMKFTLIHRSTSGAAVDSWFEDEVAWRLSWLDSDTT